MKVNFFKFEQEHLYQQVSGLIELYGQNPGPKDTLNQDELLIYHGFITGILAAFIDHNQKSKLGSGLELVQAAAEISYQAAAETQKEKQPTKINPSGLPN